MREFFKRFEAFCEKPEINSNKARSYSKAIEYLCDYLKITEMDAQAVEQIKSLEEKVTDKNSAFYKELLAFLSARKQSSYLDNGFIRAALTPFFKFVAQYLSAEEKQLFPDELSDDAVKQLHEGTVKKINVNVYERNPEARRICIKKYGCKCQVCGMDFQKTYGELGKGFIHVHHIIPLRSIKSDYIINGETDLIPVCPNCHAMLHKSVDGEFMTVEELRKIIK